MNVRNQEIIESDNTILNISWFKCKSLTKLNNLPDPDVFAEENNENLEAGID